jgi:hypothetical protein
MSVLDPEDFKASDRGQTGRGIFVFFSEFVSLNDGKLDARDLCSL